MSRLPRVCLVSTGGTIDSVGSDRSDLAWYTETNERLPQKILLESVPELSDIANIVVADFERVPSYGFSVDKWVRLANLVQKQIDSGIDAVVITHGTNTIEETAFLLSLTLHCTVPVVVVGAMRPANALGADGQLNLLQAFRLAVSDSAKGLGVLVTLNDAVFAARDLSKRSTFRTDAFWAGDLGPIGYIDADGMVDIRHKHLRNSVPPFGVVEIARMPRVDVVISHVGADGALIEAAVAAGALGIVSAGTGAGRPTQAENTALNKAAESGVVVCQSTRVPTGRVSRSPRMRQEGRIVTGSMRPWQARIALSMCLTRTTDLDQIQNLIEQI